MVGVIVKKFYLSPTSETTYRPVPINVPDKSITKEKLLLFAITLLIMGNLFWNSVLFMDNAMGLPLNSKTENLPAVSMRMMWFRV